MPEVRQRQSKKQQFSELDKTALLAVCEFVRESRSAPACLHPSRLTPIDYCIQWDSLVNKASLSAGNQRQLNRLIFDGPDLIGEGRLNFLVSKLGKLCRSREWSLFPIGAFFRPTNCRKREKLAINVTDKQAKRMTVLAQIDPTGARHFPETGGWVSEYVIPTAPTVQEALDTRLSSDIVPNDSAFERQEASA